MDTKVCGKCKQEKPISEFYPSKRDGYRSRCKLCHKEDCRGYAQTGYYAKYQTGYRQRANTKIKIFARNYTNNKIWAGKLQREPCAMCGKEQVQAHHLDYNQPLIIVWLCADCHRKVHLKELTKGIDI